MTDDRYIENLADRLRDVLDKGVRPVTIEDARRRALVPVNHYLVSEGGHQKKRRRVKLAVIVTFSLAVVGVTIARIVVPTSGVLPPSLVATSTGPCDGQPAGCSSPESSGAALARGRWSSFPAGPLSPRAGEVEVWTGRELIIWGGGPPLGSSVFGDGAAYDPATRRWHMLPRAPISPRADAMAVWTGTEMLVVGGDGAGNAVFDDAAAYDPATDKWHRIAPFPLGARSDATAIWTGRQLIVIGGGAPSTVNHGTGYEDGAVYTPATGTWENLPALPASEGSFAGVVTAWTGTELIAWVTSIVKEKCPGSGIVAGGSGQGFVTCTNTGQAGFALRAGASSWRVLPKLAVQTEGAVMAWTGSSVLVMGGEFCPITECGNEASDAASYDPVTETWANIAYSPHMNGAWPGIWTGSVFLGPDPQQVAGYQIGAYDPISRNWTLLPTPRSSVDYTFPRGVWTGRQLLFWGDPSEALTAVG